MPSFTPQDSEMLLRVAHEVLTELTPPMRVKSPLDSGPWTSTHGYSIEEICDLWVAQVKIHRRFSPRKWPPMLFAFVGGYRKHHIEEFGCLLFQYREPLAHELAFDHAETYPDAISFLLRPALRSCLGIGDTSEDYILQISKTLMIFGYQDWMSCTIRSEEDRKKFEECLQLDVLQHTRSISIAYTVLVDAWLVKACPQMQKLNCINILPQDHQKPILSISLSFQELSKVLAIVTAIQSLASNRMRSFTLQQVPLIDNHAMESNLHFLSLLPNITTLHIGWEPDTSHRIDFTAIWGLPGLRSLGLHFSPRRISLESPSALGLQQYTELCDTLLRGSYSRPPRLKGVFLHGLITSDTMPAFLGRLENSLLSCELDQIGFRDRSSWEKTAKLIREAPLIHSTEFNMIFSSACALEYPVKEAWIALVGDIWHPFQSSWKMSTVEDDNRWRTGNFDEFSYRDFETKYKPYLLWWSFHHNLKESHHNLKKLTFNSLQARKSSMQNSMREG
ncbi:hypothetical protein IQ07DRAFT_595745 [Pyrenochaeta sp. DS3sAY3a]|nr:hypothetical protein IQ07DRAFT_595745 [Pyrenochaeta sp. DS3sAY3a]